MNPKFQSSLNFRLIITKTTFDVSADILKNDIFIGFQCMLLFSETTQRIKSSDIRKDRANFALQNYI